MVAEDYIGTGLALGCGNLGVDKNFLEYLNKGLLTEDVAIWMEGERFLDGEEDNHRHENDHELTERVCKIHEELAGEQGWIRVKANQSIE